MASSRLDRTLGATGNRKIVTYSAWIKRSGLGVWQNVASFGQSGNRDYIAFDSSDRLEVAQYAGGQTYQITTTRTFRDTSAFYNIVYSIDTNESVAADRLKIYVNGVQETVFTTSSYPAEDLEMYYNLSGEDQKIGADTDNSNYFNGLMSHVNYIDGTVYGPTTFGQVDATSGIWKIKNGPSVTYGTNGFFLKFETTSGSDMGTDSSGEGNNFTESGSPTQTVDNPSNVFATCNSLNTSGSPTYANGNTTISTIGDNDSVASTLGTNSTKFYFEVKVTQTYDGSGGGIDAGAVRSEQFNAAGWPLGTFSGFNNAYTKFYGNGNDGRFKEGAGNIVTSGLTRAVAGDIIMVAVDPANNRVYCGVNGTWLNSSDPVAGTGYIGGTQATGTGTWFAYHTSDLTKGNCNVNYGNGYFGTTIVSSAGTSSTDDDSIWEYNCPTAYYGLNTKNINTYG